MSLKHRAILCISLCSMCLFGVHSQTIRRLQDTRSEISTRIVGGKAADPYRFPYAQVSVQDYKGHACGGSVVAPDLIISAAHCAENITTVVVGVYNLSVLSETVQSFGIAQKYVHEGYDPYTTEYDVMLIKIDGNITEVDPIRLNDNRSVPIATDKLAVVGWGATSVTNRNIEYPEVLQEVELYYVPNLFCKRIKSPDGFYLGSLLYDDMMCASDEGKDSCYGDSGGPLIKLGSSPADDLQVGIVSWGDVCGGAIPGIYQRLSHSYKWVQQHVCSISSAPPDSFNCFTSAPTTPPETTDAPTLSPLASTPLPTSTQSVAAPTRLGLTFAISFLFSMFV